MVGISAATSGHTYWTNVTSPAENAITQLFLPPLTPLPTSQSTPHTPTLPHLLHPHPTTPSHPQYHTHPLRSRQHTNTSTHIQYTTPTKITTTKTQKNTYIIHTLKQRRVQQRNKTRNRMRKTNWIESHQI